MVKSKGITVEVDMNTNNLSAKLRAIAKHAGTLADELDAIDNAWTCPDCGSNEYTTLLLGDEIYSSECSKCGRLVENDSSTELEGNN